MMDKFGKDVPGDYSPDRVRDTRWLDGEPKDDVYHVDKPDRLITGDVIMC